MLHSAQRNYPVHEIEMLAGIETMLRYKDILQGVHFKWIMDHKGLIYLMSQKNLSGCQARWMEKISSFVFKVIYVAGSENVITDALSRLYSNDSEGIIWSKTEFTYHDISDVDTPPLLDSSSLAALRQRHETPAESGCPESSRAFAACMRDHFIFRGPGE